MTRSVIIPSVLLSLTQVPGTLAGQGRPDWTVVNAETCASASQIAQDIDSPERRYALGHLSRCGPQGGRALARELRQLRDESDVVAMQRMFIEIARIRDAEVLEAALELAADRGATLEARVAALRIFVEYQDPTVTTTFGYFMLPRSNSSLMVGQDGGRREGAPLPDNWMDDVRMLLARIMEDPSEGESMRHGARRALYQFRGS